MKKIFLIWVFVSLFSFSLVSAALTEGIFSYQTLDSADLDGLIFKNSVDQAHNCSLVNSLTTGVDGIINEAASVNGSADDGYLNCGDSANLNLSDFTYTMWVRHDEFSGLFRQVALGNPTCSDNNNCFQCGHEGSAQSGDNQTWFCTSTNFFGMFQDSGLTVEEWYFIAVTRTNNNVQFYRDGVKKGNNWTHNYAKNLTGLTYGMGSNTGEDWRGDIEEIGMWNRALSSAEILELYNNGTGLQYPFTNTVTITQSTYNVTSALQNGTAWRTNTSFPVPIAQSTPAISFDVSGAANCSIGTVDKNYTDMLVENTDRECATLLNTSQTCTLPTSDKLTLQDSTVYIACVGNLGVETNASTSGPLKISLYGDVSGTVWDESSSALENATVYVIGQAADTLNSVLTTNSTGGWITQVPIGLYTIVGVDKANVTIAGSVKPHVNVTAS